MQQNKSIESLTVRRLPLDATPFFENVIDDNVTLKTLSVTLTSSKEQPFSEKPRSIEDHKKDTNKIESALKPFVVHLGDNKTLSKLRVSLGLELEIDLYRRNDYGHDSTYASYFKDTIRENKTLKTLWILVSSKETAEIVLGALPKNQHLEEIKLAINVPDRKESMSLAHNISRVLSKSKTLKKYSITLNNKGDGAIQARGLSKGQISNVDIFVSNFTELEEFIKNLKRNPDSLQANLRLIITDDYSPTLHKVLMKPPFTLTSLKISNRSRKKIGSLKSLGEMIRQHENLKKISIMGIERPQDMTSLIDLIADHPSLVDVSLGTEATPTSLEAIARMIKLNKSIKEINIPLAFQEPDGEAANKARREFIEGLRKIYVAAKDSKTLKRLQLYPLGYKGEWNGLRTPFEDLGNPLVTAIQDLLRQTKTLEYFEIPFLLRTSNAKAIAAALKENNSIKHLNLKTFPTSPYIEALKDHATIERLTYNLVEKGVSKSWSGQSGDKDKKGDKSQKPKKPRPTDEELSKEFFIADAKKTLQSLSELLQSGTIKTFTTEWENILQFEKSKELLGVSLQDAISKSKQLQHVIFTHSPYEMNPEEFNFFKSLKNLFKQNPNLQEFRLKSHYER